MTPNKKEKSYIYSYLTLIIIVCCVVISLLENYLYKNSFGIDVSYIDINNDIFKTLDIEVPFEDIKNKANEINLSCGELVTVIMAINSGKVDSNVLNAISPHSFTIIRNKLIRVVPENFKNASKVYNSIVNDITYFPVPKSSKDFPWVSFVDSWGYERTYGGKRSHQGTDIMADKNIAGVYPIVSISDGTVTNMGWLELGGYRIGITSAGGTYYYYAHLSAYATGLKEGDTVTAGTLLGFMGNTGYSKVEGTSGKFDVHLHFGIYITGNNGEEIALNPYYLLKNNENKVLYYNYKV